MLIILSGFDLQCQKFCSDNGDGSYTNPVIYADFPDPDVILVDSIYYMVTTTMFIFPGVTVLKSRDLVNWEYCANVVERMEYSKCYNLDGCDRYSRGQWASSIKYWKGKFYIMFNTLDDGGFLCTADKPDGKWQIRRLSRGFHDPGLFFDGEEKIYVAHGYNNIYITELDTNFTPKGNDVLVYTGKIRPGLEGTHVYKINGYYYLYCTYGGWDGFQVALRSKNIYGPYEKKVVLNDFGNLGTGIHQGALVPTVTGEWWTILMQDGGPFGRFVTLQPVNWIDDWPIVGINGKGVVTYKKPNVGKNYSIKILPTSDEFNDSTLGLQWGWNHNPDKTKWSLIEKPGYLRLHTVKVVSNLKYARNNLTQRIFAYYTKNIPTVATAKFEIQNMKDGDIAGLAIFQDPYAFVGVKKRRDSIYVIMVNNGIIVDSIKYDESIIYFRAIADYGTNIATFNYSKDNNIFYKLGNQLEMKYNLSIFTGNKFCLFNYPTIQTGGYVDIDWFRVEPFLPVSLKDNSFNDIKIIYDANGNLHISSEILFKKIIISDIMGRKIFYKHLNEYKKSEKVKIELLEGVYIVTVLNENTIVSEKYFNFNK